MKKLFLMMAIFLGFSSGLYAWVLQPGTYGLIGSINDFWNTGYYGEAVIFPQGDHYNVLWKNGSSQTQVGIGSVDGDVFSVAFVDLINPSCWGIITYYLTGWGELQGSWTHYNGVSSGSECLFWKNSFIH